MIYKFEGNEYECKDGIIVSPGKFEGEPVYVLHFWSMALDGGADVDDEDGFQFELSDEDRADYPALGDAEHLTLWGDDQGFVRHKLD